MPQLTIGVVDWEGTGGKPQSHAAQRLWVTYLEHLGCFGAEVSSLILAF